MYNQNKWWDEVVEHGDLYHFTDNGNGTANISPFPGEVIQTGTPQNQFNFDNLENGVQGAHIAAAILLFNLLHFERRQGEQYDGMEADIDALRERLERTERAAADALETGEEIKFVAALTMFGNLQQQRENIAAFEETSEVTRDIQFIAAMTMFGNLQWQRQDEAQFTMLSEETLGEEHEITLTNSKRYPFNSTMDNPITVALATRRRNLFYSVETEVVSHNGEVGEIHVTNKALNGFKISFDGPAKAVTLIVRIKGGMT